MDAATARLQDARTILSRAVIDLPEGKVRECAALAYAACGDALEAHTALARTRANLEVLADVLAAPGADAAEEAA